MFNVYYLGGEVIGPRANGPPNSEFAMRQPGALHHSFLIAKGLYILMIAMLEVDELPLCLLSANKQAGIVRIAQFIALFHTQYFLTARLPSHREDLTLWKNMCIYNAHDRQVTTAVKASIKRHQWYLTEQFVILSLFDNELADEEKAAISTALHTCVRPLHFPRGKPEFYNNRLTRDSPRLAGFVGPNSNPVFHLLGIDSGWLTLAP